MYISIYSRYIATYIYIIHIYIHILNIHTFFTYILHDNIFLFFIHVHMYIYIYKFENARSEKDRRDVVSVLFLVKWWGKVKRPFNQRFFRESPARYPPGNVHTYPTLLKRKTIDSKVPNGKRGYTLED